MPDLVLMLNTDNFNHADAPEHKNPAGCSEVHKYYTRSTKAHPCLPAVMESTGRRGEHEVFLQDADDIADEDLVSVSRMKGKTVVVTKQAALELTS